MKTVILTIILLLLINSVMGQDILYKKNGSTISCKVREITVEVIKYKRTDLANSPIFEIAKDDVYKIRYKNGVVDVLDPAYNKIKRDSISKSLSDTLAYSMLYVVFNSGQSSQTFPLYINGNFICKLKNHSRLAFKMLYEGESNVCRIMKNKVGPSRKLIIQHGYNYGIGIEIVNEQTLDPNNRFEMTVYEESSEVQGFLKNEYYGFEPFKALDFHIVEKAAQLE